MSSKRRRQKKESPAPSELERLYSQWFAHETPSPDVNVRVGVLKVVRTFTTYSAYEEPLTVAEYVA